MNLTRQSVFSRNVYGFTAGGPVRKDKTFFFGGFQQDTFRSTANFPVVVPTEAAVSTLRSLFPSNPRLASYLGFLGGLRGTASPFPLQLGDDPVTGVNRGVVQFATAPLALSQSNEGPEWLARLDHHLSEAHRLAFRYIHDSRTTAPRFVYFPGFVLDAGSTNQNFLFTDHYTLSGFYARTETPGESRPNPFRRREHSRTCSSASSHPPSAVWSVHLECSRVCCKAGKQTTCCSRRRKRS